MPDTSRSIRSAWMSRLRQAKPIALASFMRSKGSRSPSFLTTVRSRSWTRSKVVKRAPQPSHWRRRRIAAPSSAAANPLPGYPRGHRRGSASAIDREAGAQSTDAFVDLAFDHSVGLHAIGSQAVQNVGDHVGDVAELRFAEAPRGAGWGADGGAAGRPRRG